MPKSHEFAHTRHAIGKILTEFIRILDFFVFETFIYS